MKPLRTFFGFLALGAAAAGCTTDAPPATGDGSGDGSGGDPVHELDATGKYAMRSTFDIASNLPSTVGVVTNDFIAATDDPDDPTRWLLQQIVNKLPAGA